MIKEYFKLIDFLSYRNNKVYDLENKNDFLSLFSYFSSDYKKEYWDLYQNGIFNSRLNEEQMINWLIKIINENNLKEYKTKEELINFLKKEKIDNVFLASCFIMLRNLISTHISIRLYNTDGTPKVQNNKPVYSNYFDENLKRLICLYVTNNEKENDVDSEIIINKLFMIDELSKLHFIRDISTLKNTLYSLFVELKQI